MVPRLLSLIVLALWGFSVAADPLPAPAWQEYRSVQGGYRVEMPGKPAEIVQDLPSAPGQKMYAATLNYNHGGLLAVASDIAADRDSGGDEKLLDLSRDTALKSMNVTMANERKETVGKYPARRFDYSGGNGYSGTIRLILAGKRLYQLNAIGPAGFSQSPEARRFLDSFALTGN